MIAVIEGISAAGKSTWCARCAGGMTVPEMGPVPHAPDRQAEPKRAAEFWAEINARRWATALALEAQTGCAVCDTDPLKLHYTWCLMQIGAASEEEFEAARIATRRRMGARRLGFADIYFVKAIDPIAARTQRDGDKTRSRRNFDLHVRLQPALLVWYRRLEQVLPGSVVWEWPANLPPVPPVSEPADWRYDLSAFDRMIASVPPLVGQAQIAVRSV